MNKRILPILLVMAMLIAALSVTAMAATNVAPNEVSNYAKTELSAALATVATNGSGKAYCPACNKEVTWYSTNSGADVNLVSYHWFIQGKMDRKGTYTVDAGKTACYYLNGFDLTSTAIGFNVAGTLNIIGNGTETVSGTGDGGYGKGSTINVNGGTVNLYGGKYTKQDTVGNAVVALPVANGTVNMYAGTTITGGTSSRSGGNVCLTGNPTKFNMYGGTVSDGKAYQGGNLYAETGGVITIDGGSVTGGSATNDAGVGGNVALYNTSIYLKSGTISGGTAVNGATIGLQAANLFQTGGSITGGTASNGGAIYGQNGPIVQISAGSVSGGKVTGQGGNIMMKGGTLTVSGTAQITDGEAKYGGGNIYIWGGNTTTISGGTISGGKNTATYGGGNLCVENAKATISGGTIKEGTATNGGNIYTFASASGSYGLFIQGTATVKDGTASYGGNICNAGTLTATGGTISGGSAAAGGSVYMGSGSSVSLTGVSVTGGTATGNGGNFYLNNAQLTLENCSVSGGKSDSYGGNIYGDTKDAKLTVKGTTTISGGNANSGGNITIHDQAKLEIQSGEISQGIAANYGGNIYMMGGTLTQTGGTVKNGTSSTDRGGNLYVNAGVTAEISNATYEGGNANVYGGNIFNGGVLTVTDTAITGGTAARGGNVHLASGATFTGCTISDGTASYGGNIRADGSATGAFTNCDITGGTLVGSSSESGGGNLDVRGACTFDNCTLEVSASASGSGSQFYNEALQTFTNCTLTNGTVMGDGDVTLNSCVVNLNNLNMRKNVLTVNGNTTVSKATFNEPAGLHVMKGFTGTVNFASMVGAPESPIYGKELGEKYTAEGDFTGKVILQFDVEEPWACNKDGKLMASASRTVKDGVVTWFADNDKALEGYGDADYLWPLISGTMNLNGDYTVDLAGTDQIITGDGNVTLFDSANADFKTYGTATVNGPKVANNFETLVQGNMYYMLSDANSYTFHRLENTVNGVSLRPSAAGIYYTSNWACDDALKALIQNFGVAVSVYNQPQADFATDTDTLYTQFDKESFESGVTKTSVLITDIFHENVSTNTQRGMKPIYATAYVTFQNGDSLFYAVDRDEQRYSLHDVLTILDRHSDDYSAYAETLENFMTKWSQYGVTGADWEFTFSVAPEIKQLNAMYAGKTAYHGEMHDHANTGGRSDGKQTLQTWIDGMKKLKMDFATIVDHDQSRHMYLDEWDDATFIGGTETTGWLTGKATVSHGEFHMNLIFAEVDKFEAFIAEYADVFKAERDPETGSLIFKVPPEGVAKDSPEYKAAYTYLPADKEYLTQLAAAVRKHGGFFAHVHPRQAMQSTNIEDYWFGDWTGLEVQYTYGADRNSAKSQANYQLWKDLLAAGKKIYATAGNDDHDMPTVKALTTIYAPENTAVSLVEQMREGNFNPGPIGIRMAIGDTPMGKECDFTGKKLAFVIGDIHESELAGEHNYHVDLYKGSEVVQSWDMPATGDNFYQVVEIDENADFYRIEVIDVEGDTIDRVALSQPIWNTK